jgi:hypothetical protein
MKRLNYGLALAPTGEWVVIDTAYSPGIMDRCNEEGRGFTLIVAPATFVDQKLRLDHLTGCSYIFRRESGPTIYQKKRAIESYWDGEPIANPFSKITQSETTDWFQRVEYINRQTTKS